MEGRSGAGELAALRERVADNHWLVRHDALLAIANGWPDQAAYVRLRATADSHWQVRRAGVRVVAATWPQAPETVAFLVERASIDRNGAVRVVAVEALAGYPEAAEVLPLLRRLETEKDWQVRRAAAGAITRGWPEERRAGQTPADRWEDDEDWDGSFGEG